MCVYIYREWEDNNQKRRKHPTCPLQYIKIHYGELEQQNDTTESAYETNPCL